MEPGCGPEAALGAAAGAAAGAGAGAAAAGFSAGGAHVLFRDGAIGAGTGHGRKVDSQFLGHPARGRHGAHGSGLLVLGRRGGSRGRGGRSSGGSRCFTPGHAFRGLARIGDDADDLFHRDNLARRGNDLEQNTTSRGFHHIGDLIRLHFQQRLPGLEASPLGHEPSGNLPGFHGQAPFGHEHLMRHFGSSSRFVYGSSRRREMRHAPTVRVDP
jgi:hypothetical protein